MLRKFLPLPRYKSNQPFLSKCCPLNLLERALCPYKEKGLTIPCTLMNLDGDFADCKSSNSVKLLRGHDEQICTASVRKTK